MKLLAIIMILSSSLLTATAIIQKEKRHCDALSKSVTCLNTIKNKAIFYAEPLRRIAEEISTNEPKQIPDYITEFLNIENEPTPAAWELAVKKSKSELTEKERELIISFGCGLCTCNREQITEHSEKVINELNTILKSIKEKKDSKIKITSALSLSVGITAVLILI